MRSISFLVVVLALLRLTTGCNSASAGFCEKTFDCDPDVDEDAPQTRSDIEQCIDTQTVFLDELRGYGEADCTALADAFEAKAACFATLEDCNEFNEPNNGTCVDETETLRAACDAVVDDSCARTAVASCGVGDEA